MNSLICRNPFRRQKRPTKPIAKYDEDLDAIFALIKSRPRALTLPLPQDHTVGPGDTQMTLDQSSSPFFAQLPMEIRMLIYAEVFGGRRLHLIVHPKDGRLAHVHCLLSHIRASEHICDPLSWRRRSFYWDPIEPMNPGTCPYLDLPRCGGLLGLLKTCRRV